MNARPNVQNFKSSNSPLLMVTGSKGQFNASASRHSPATDGNPESISAVNMHLPAGKNIHFVERVQALIEANMADETYGIDQLCRDVGASRSQIHNKLKKWTGLSTTYFIRAIKLHRAKYLLVQTDLNITQVAYEIGFNDPSYFSRVFDESFGICPKNFRKRWQKTYSAA